MLCSFLSVLPCSFLPIIFGDSRINCSPTCLYYTPFTLAFIKLAYTLNSFKKSSDLNMNFTLQCLIFYTDLRCFRVTRKSWKYQISIWIYVSEITKLTHNRRTVSELFHGLNVIFQYITNVNNYNLLLFLIHYTKSNINRPSW